MHPWTLAVTAGRSTNTGEPLNPALIAASNFRIDPQATAAQNREYARNEGTPQWEAFEQAIEVLEGGPTVSFASGMAAAAAITQLIPPGATIIAPEDCYQGVATLFVAGIERLGWQVKWLPTANTDQWLQQFDSDVDLVWLESPSNPMLAVCDVPLLCRSARAMNISCVVDNTFATPLLQQPLSHGANYSLHSATKFIGGHSDLTCGMVACDSFENAARLRHQRALHGATPGALESLLGLRGLRTLPLRLHHAQASAAELAVRLDQHPKVRTVHYPGLATSPFYEITKRTMAGPGAMISFETSGTSTDLDRALGNLQLIVNATSLGGVESTIERRNRLAGQEHVPATLLRLSVGVEHVEDLWNDLEKLLDA